MREAIIQKIAGELKIREKQVLAVLEMLEDKDTVAFIARYRKEATGALDEEQILFIEKEYKYQLTLAERKESVLNLISQQGKLTDEIRQAIMACEKLSQVEDLYKPYKQKKKTRAAMAIAKGLQPLADVLLRQPLDILPEKEAEKYLSEEVRNIQEALQGASDILAENVSDNAKLRWDLKERIQKSASLKSRKKADAQDEKKVYEMYYDFTEKVTSLADHRIMALDRAEKEKIVTVTFDYDRDAMISLAERLYVNPKSPCASLLSEAVRDGCERLLFPSVENEIRSDLSDRAHNASIEIFSLNLEKLLLQPPLKGRVVLGFDPGYYNGCKLAVLDDTGKLLAADKIYPFRKDGDISKSRKKLLDLIQKYGVRIVAIGNGTASRESERLVSSLIQEEKLDVSYAIVSEAGASVWSAQEEARREFPDLAVEERSAVSIGRRLLDPLSELIRIDPRSIGVGQYQHDLPEKQLTERLDEVTVKAVNRVGADLNTASEKLLSYISGLNAGIAKEIVDYRNKNGRFTRRSQLTEVKKLGPKIYQQCAGFLRIMDGEEPLDATSIHPESYEKTKQLMQLCGISQLGDPHIVFDQEKIKDLNIDSYTLKDIEDAIRQPLRDYRDSFEGAILKSDILELSDLHVGDRLTGTVRNVVDFGAFIDIGLHDDGLVHISRMSTRRIQHPSEILSVNDIVTVYVYEIDLEKERVSLSLLPLEQLQERNRSSRKQQKDRKPQEKKREAPSEEEAMKRLLDRFGSKHS